MEIIKRNLKVSNYTYVLENERSNLPLNDSPERTEHSKAINCSKMKTYNYAQKLANASSIKKKDKNLHIIDLTSPSIIKRARINGSLASIKAAVNKDISMPITS
jgi:hypothetical protein